MTFPADTALDLTKFGTIETDITYGNADGISLKMDIYYPKITKKPVPAVVYVHGGAWCNGDKGNLVWPEGLQELITRGYLVSAINYRLAPHYKFPAQIEDVKCAIRFLRTKASICNLDSSRIGAWGSSAGGHLAALLGVTDRSVGFEGSGGWMNQSSQVQGVVDMWGPTDLPSFKGNSLPLELVFGTADYQSEILRRASPLTYVSKSAPPFLILHGEKDDIVPPAQSYILYNKLVSANVPASLVMVENAGHTLVPYRGPISPTRAEVTQMIADFFDSCLK